MRGGEGCRSDRRTVRHVWDGQADGRMDGRTAERTAAASVGWAGRGIGRTVGRTNVQTDILTVSRRRSFGRTNCESVGRSLGWSGVRACLRALVADGRDGRDRRSVGRADGLTDVCDRRELEERSVKALDEDVKIGVIIAPAPPPAQNHCHLNSHIFAGQDDAFRLLSSTDRSCRFRKRAGGLVDVWKVDKKGRAKAKSTPQRLSTSGLRLR